MSRPQFQEGDWRARKVEGRCYGEPDVWCVEWSDDQEEVVEICHGEANARLISAAKELYSALEGFVSNSSAQVSLPDECELAERALAKALGIPLPSDHRGEV